MVQIDIEYQGELRCRAVHQPSGTALVTDPPLDNQGRGESFSPSDLVATALGSCMLTIMGIVAARHGWPLTGARARVVKSMVADPARRIGKLAVEIRVPGTFDAQQRQALVNAAHTCPVHKSLARETEITVEFVWGTA